MPEISHFRVLESLNLTLPTIQSGVRSLADEAISPINTNTTIIYAETMEKANLGEFEDRAVGYTLDEARQQQEFMLQLRRSGRLDVERILDWDRGEKQVSAAKVLLVDSVSPYGV